MRECYDCGNEDTSHVMCPESTRECGHHCTCSWVFDRCCDCGEIFGEDE